MINRLGHEQTNFGNVNPYAAYGSGVGGAQQLLPTYQPQPVSLGGGEQYSPLLRGGGGELPANGPNLLAYNMNTAENSYGLTPQANGIPRIHQGTVTQGFGRTHTAGGFSITA